AGAEMDRGRGARFTAIRIGVIAIAVIPVRIGTAIEIQAGISEAEAAKTAAIAIAAIAIAAIASATAAEMTTAGMSTPSATTAAATTAAMALRHRRTGKS